MGAATQGQDTHPFQPEIKSGSVIHTDADKVEKLELVTSGKVEIIGSEFRITAERGAILGLFEFPGENYNYTYVAKETCTLESWPFRRKSDVDPIVKARSGECDVLVSANAAMTLSLLGHYKRNLRRAELLKRTISQGYADYRKLCVSGSFEIQSWPLAEELEQFIPETDLPDWLGDYYDQLGLMPSGIKKNFYSVHTSLTTAAILESVSHIQLIRRLFDQLENYSNGVRVQYESEADLYDLYTNLKQRCRYNPKVCEYIDKKLAAYVTALEKTGLVPESILDKYRQKAAPVPAEVPAETKAAESTGEDDPFRQLERSLDRILAYTQLDEAEEERFREMIDEYKALNDKNSADNEVRRLRKDLSKGFFDLYESAVLQAMEDRRRPPAAVRLFLCFGYMDEELTGRENALQLLKLLEQVEQADEEEELELVGFSDKANKEAAPPKHIYTIFEWLSAIYRGAREPSKNEFEQDYPQWLRSRRQSGDITEEQEKRYLNSPRERMRFELDNFFHLGMRIASGRPSVFCPLLSAHNIVRSLEQTLVTAAAIEKNWADIKKTDYSLFFREALYQNPDYKLPRETILLEVMPDVILLPMVGSRGGLWQEIAGVHRDTPARMFLPIFCSEDLSLIQLRMAAQFRWQICRRVQGARWNDVSDPSLTADYCDYLQFYRKNSELSPDAREKVKSEILSCKNSFENVFVLDYIQWIRFEAHGSPRLTKVAKRILFSYCPFSAEIRKRLESNPMYADLVRRHDGKAAKQLKLLLTKYDKTKKEYGSLPKTIEAYIKYFSS
ncbi:MAG: Crp/Fnr family transcriptional regulator [Lachnospiraceae bacterium]|nr:Crp/Fnr family transcriptional regulator [Lachnospiraceae bacterium]